MNIQKINITLRKVQRVTTVLIHCHTHCKIFRIGTHVYYAYHDNSICIGYNRQMLDAKPENPFFLCYVNFSLKMQRFKDVRKNDARIN